MSPEAATEKLLEKVESASLEEVQTLLDAGADPNAKDKEGKTGLYLAMQNNWAVLQTPDDVQVADFDATKYLSSPAAIAAFLDEAAATGDAKFMAHCLGLVAKTVGMGKIAGQAGVNRQALYKALSGEREPRISTVMTVLDALGIQLHVELADARTE